MLAIAGAAVVVLVVVVVLELVVVAAAVAAACALASVAAAPGTVDWRFWSQTSSGITLESAPRDSTPEASRFADQARDRPYASSREVAGCALAPVGVEAICDWSAPSCSPSSLTDELDGQRGITESPVMISAPTTPQPIRRLLSGSARLRRASLGGARGRPAGG